MKESLYRRLGEDLALHALCEMLYERIRLDEDLYRFFDGVSFEKLHKKQVSFLSHVLGGPQLDEAIDLRAAHRPLVQAGMDEAHYDTITFFIADILKDLDVSAKDIAEVVTAINAFKDEVLDR